MSKTAWFLLAVGVILPLSAIINISRPNVSVALWWVRAAVILALAIGYTIDHQRKAGRPQ